MSWVHMLSEDNINLLAIIIIPMASLIILTRKIYVSVCNKVVGKILIKYNHE